MMRLGDRCPPLASSPAGRFLARQRQGTPPEGPSPDALRHVARAARSGGREPVDRLVVAEVDLPVRRGLHRVDRAAGAVQHVIGPPDTSSRAAFSAIRGARRRSRRRRTARPRPGCRQAAAVAERVPGDADRSARTRASGGRRGVGPLPFVSPGDCPRQFSFGPQPKFPPPAIRLISSLHSGPFSVSHRRSVLRVEREPERVADAEREHQAARDRVVRRHAAARRHAQDLAAEVAPTGPARSSCRGRRRRSRRACRRGRTGCRPPLWYGLELAGCDIRTRIVRVPVRTVTFRIWFLSRPPVDRVA